MFSRHSLFVLLALVPGCAAPSPWKRTAPPLYNSPHLVLFQEHLETAGQREPLGHQHPIQVSPEKLAAILGQLIHDKRTLLKSRQVPVFVPEQVPTMVEPLSLALGKLGPDERLRFVAIQSGLLGKVFRPYGTTGVMFSRQTGTLDIAFVEIDEALSLPDDNAPMKIRFDDEPTELTDASPVLPAAGIQLQTAPNVGTFPRWITIRLDEVAALPSPLAAKVAAATLPATPVPAAPTPSVPTPSVATPPNQEEIRYQKLRARLETLSRLRQDGALSEEQYKLEYEKTMAELKG